MTNYLTNGQYRADKSALTRAINAGDAKAIIVTVERTFAKWEQGNYAYPDDWHRWERAREDAYDALGRAGWRASPNR